MAVAAAVAAAGVLAGTAVSATDTTVSIVGCTEAHGGNVTVPAGSTISFRLGWVARSTGLDEAFLRDITTTATVDGTPVADADSYWSQPVATTTQSGSKAYEVDWLYPTGITLESGQSLTLTFQGELARPITDGFQSQGGGRAPAGDLLGGHDTCTVTAA